MKAKENSQKQASSHTPPPASGGQGLSRYFTSQTVEVWRSSVKTAGYNPRKISDEARKKLKANIKKNGVLGGLVWNKATGTLVSGHQRLSVLDELNGYDGEKSTDYRIKVEAISVDEKAEKELNIWFNNAGVQGEFDYDLAELIPEIDYKSAGLSDDDLQLIGIDFTLQTDAEKSIAQDFDEMLAPVREEKEKKIAQVKEAKRRVKEQAEEAAMNQESYVVINFQTYQRKDAFMQRFGFGPDEKFIVGEKFSEMIERVD